MISIGLLNQKNLQPFMHMTFPVFQKEIIKLEESGALVAFGASVNQQPVGLALATLDEDRSSATFSSLYVEPEFRGRHIGTALTQSLMNEIQMRGRKKMTATYITEGLSHLFLEKILFMLKWEEGISLWYFMNFQKKKGFPLFPFKLPPLPSGFELSLFSELSSAERQDLISQEGILYPDYLDPFLEEEAFEPINSLVCRKGKRSLDGWSIIESFPTRFAIYNCG